MDNEIMVSHQLMFLVVILLEKFDCKYAAIPFSIIIIHILTFILMSFESIMV